MNGSSPIAGKIANSGVIVSWFGVFLSHIDDINKVLQFVALVLAITASGFAIRFHTKKKPQ